MGLGFNLRGNKHAVSSCCFFFGEFFSSQFLEHAGCSSLPFAAHKVGVNILTE